MGDHDKPAEGPLAVYDLGEHEPEEETDRRYVRVSYRTDVLIAGDDGIATEPLLTEELRKLLHDWSDGRYSFVVEAFRRALEELVQAAVNGAVYNKLQETHGDELQATGRGSWTAQSVLSNAEFHRTHNIAVIHHDSDTEQVTVAPQDSPEPEKPMGEADFVCVLDVEDPASSTIEEIEVWRDVNSGGLFAIDSSFLEQVRHCVPSPFNPEVFDLPEEHVHDDSSVRPEQPEGPTSGSQ